MSKDSFYKLCKKAFPRPDSYLAVVTTVMAGATIFFFSQVFVVIAVTIVFAIVGKSQEDLERLFVSPDSYVPKALMLALIMSIMVYMIFRALNIWDRVETKLKRLENGNKSKKLNKKHKYSYKDGLKFLRMDKSLGLVDVMEVFAAYGVYVVSLIVAVFVVSATGTVDVNQAQDLGVNPPLGVAGVVSVFVMFVVLPPIGEEILFRGFVFGKIAKHSNIITAYVLTSLLFGAAHLEFSNLNWVAAIDTLIFSVFLIAISRRHASLYSAMMLHAIKNSVAFVLFLLG